MSNKSKKIVLIILDGWGLSPSWGGNAIAMNNPPFVNSLLREYPNLVLQAFYKIAGRGGKVGSSEIGHASIGCGRLIFQDLSRINQSIKNGSFFKNEILIKACKNVKKKNSSLHLLGLLSDGGIHSHIDHLFALLDLAKKQGLKKVFIEAFTDGRDTPANSAITYLKQLEDKIKTLSLGSINTISGRFYALDRDGNWERTARVYQALVKGKGQKGDHPRETIISFYGKGIFDEFIPPIIIKGETIKDGDSVIFFNFRADRARQLTRAFVDPHFRPFWCFRKPKTFFVTFTLYQKDLPLFVAFPPSEIRNSLAEVLAKNKIRQLRLGESEKYAHITYFFNGGKEEPFEYEDRVIIPSPKVDSFDKTPKMKAEELTKTLLLKLPKYDFILLNFANVDMLGHTGNILATSEAITTVDHCLEKIVNGVLEKDGLVIITADHGNAEQMVHLKGEGDPETLHTLNPVPFILVGKKYKRTTPVPNLKAKDLLSKMIRKADEEERTLADIAPTILDLLKIKKPKEMSGKSLLPYLEKEEK